MAGPGGGGHSGGGGRGGFSGGSRGGGSFGGGFHGGHHHHHHIPMGGGWHHRPGHYNGGGGCGCCGGFFGMGILVFILIFVLILSIGSYSEEKIFSSDGYDEELFQDFANDRYEAEFGRSSAYEDNLLLTVLVSEDYYNFYYIAWVGDHIDYEINCLLGNNDTALGQTMERCISATNYKYSLDSDLARVMQTMADEIQSLGLAGSFTCAEDHAQVKSHLTNLSHLELTEDTVNDALTAFTDATGIPVVIVVEDMDDVFVGAGQTHESSSTDFGGVFILGVMAGVLVVALVVAWKAIRRRNEQLD